jgi:hypothetical protein
MEVPAWIILVFAGIGGFLSLLIILGLVYNVYIKRLNRLGGEQSEMLKILENYDPEARAEMLQAAMGEAEKVLKEEQAGHAQVLKETLAQLKSDAFKKKVKLEDEEMGIGGEPKALSEKDKEVQAEMRAKAKAIEESGYEGKEEKE